MAVRGAVASARARANLALILRFAWRSIEYQGEHPCIKLLAGVLHAIMLGNTRQILHLCASHDICFSTFQPIALAAPLSKTFTVPSPPTEYSISFSTRLSPPLSGSASASPFVILNTPLTSAAKPVSNSLKLIE